VIRERRLQETTQKYTNNARGKNRNRCAESTKLVYPYHGLDNVIGVMCKSGL